MKRLILLITLFSLACSLFAQSVGINTTGASPDTTAILDVQATDKGLLLPRMTRAQRDAISSPAEGLMIYNLDDSCFNYYAGNRWILDCGLSKTGKSLPPISFVGEASSEGEAIAVDQAGNRYLTGQFSDSLTLGSTQLLSMGRTDVFLTKISPEGEVLWAVPFGGSDRDSPGDIFADDLGNSYLMGSFRDKIVIEGDTLTSAGSYDIYVVKVSPSGQVLWTAQVRGRNSDTGTGITVDGAGNSFITGNFRNEIVFGSDTLVGQGNSDLFIAKLNPAGQFVWAITGGGNEEDASQNIELDQIGNILVVGYFRSSTVFGPFTLNGSGRDGFIVKVSPTGQYLWAANAGGSGFKSFDGLAVDHTGEVYVSGGFEGTATFGSDMITSKGFSDMFVSKLSSNGTFLWTMGLGGTGVESGKNIALDANDHGYVTGFMEYSVIVGSDTLTSAGVTDVVLVKFTHDGQFVWAKSGGSVEIDGGNDIAVDPFGRVSVTGFIMGPANFGGMSVPFLGNALNDRDVFLWTVAATDGANAPADASLSEVQDGDRDATNEFQNLSLSSSQLSLTNGGSVDLSSFLDNTDAQSLSLNATQLSLINGGSVDLSSFLDNTDAQSLSLSSNQLSLTNGGSVDLSSFLDNTDAQSLSLNATQLSLINGGSVDLSSFLDNTDAQSLSLNSSQLSLTNGGSVDLSSFLDNTDAQSLSLNSSQLSLTNGGSVDLSSFLDNTDSQSLTLSGSQISLTNGGSVNLSSLLDSSDKQSLSLSGNQLTLFNGGSVDLSDFLDNTDSQSLSLSGSQVSLTNGGSVDLSGFLDNTDSQSLSLSGSQISLTNGGSVNLSSLLDSSDNQSLSLNANQLSLINGGSVDLSSFLDNTDNQSLTLSGSQLSLSNGGSVDLSSFLDNTDNQSLTLTGNQISLTNGGSVDLSSFLDNTDNQSLTLTGNQISLTNGGSVDLSSFLDNTDNQSLSLAGNQLSLSNGGSVDLSSFLDNTDNQSLTLSGSQLSLSNGGSVDLAPLQDNLGDHTATQNLQLGNHYLSGDGQNEGIFVDTAGRVGIGTNMPRSLLDLGTGLGRKFSLFNTPTDFYGLGISGNTLELYANGSINTNLDPQMVIKSSGNVGIGTLNPLHALDFGPGVGRRLALAQNSAGTDFYGFAISANTLEIHASSTPAEDPGMVLKLDGKVGMGTTSPQSRLDVEGGLAVGSTYAGTSAAPADGAIIEGNVGIGTNNPTQAKVVISGSTASLIGNPHGWLNSSGAIGFPGVRNLSLSLWASNGIAALEFIAFSDARIKDIHGISDSEADLATLMQIEITDYRMKDTLAKGTAITKKVIAQQVAEVYPQAVTSDLTEVIPDIYQRAEVQDSWIMLATDLKVGERVKLITEASAKVYEVAAVEADRFQVADFSDPELVEGPEKEVFVYGREVDDFHTVDYEAISMLNVSATQAQQLRIEALEVEGRAKEAKIEWLEKQLQHLQHLEGRLQALEATMLEP